MRVLLGLGAVGFVASCGLVACGGASSSSLGGGGGGDSGAGSSSEGGPDTGTTSGDTGTSGDSGSGGTDTGSPDAPGGGGDSGSPEAGSCPALGAGATDVYVDKRYAGAVQTGVQACPFTTITAGLAAAATLTGMRTVHVAGATPALVYAEASSLDVAADVTLSGDGAGKTTIQASGPCGGSATCAVAIEGGGTLAGFTVTSSGGDGIATAAGSPAPVVHDALATGSMSNGLLAAGDVELGPNFSADANGSAGVESPMGAGGTVHVIGTADTFDGNKGNGIDVSGTATLNFEGGTANGNAQGIRLAGATASSTGHTITSLTATGNTGPGGVVAYNGQTIKMRSSTLTGNTGVGLYYAYVGSGTLDIGTANDAGGNVFGGMSTGTDNGLAGLRLCGVTAAGMLAAQGDSWSACPPSQTFADCSNSAPKGYSDILYGPNLSMMGTPVTAGGCTVGP